MTTTTETLTPAEFAALPDGELNELAHRLIIGGGFPHAFTVQDGEHDYCEACGEKDTTDKPCRFGPDYAASDAAAFMLVDALIVRRFNLEIDYPCQLQGWLVEFFVIQNSERHRISRRFHASRARAITEAAVLAAMATKEGE